MGVHKKTVSIRILNKLAALTTLIIFAGLLFFYESAKERYYAEVVNLSGKVRGGIQRASKLYLGNDFKNLKVVINQVDLDLQHLEKHVEYIKLPVVDWGKCYRPKNVEACWSRVKNSFTIPPTPLSREKILKFSEICWIEADKLTDLYEKIVSRNLFILNAFYAGIFIASISIILLLVRIIVIEINQNLEKRASFDALTGILNRATFLEIFEKLSKASKNFPMGLIVFDLDNFKKINDTYGHNAGDRVLQEVAKVARRHIKKTGYLVRWGGEEFVILLPKTNVENARRIAERLRALIEQLKIMPCGAKVTASFGVTEVHEGESLEEAFERADKALYKAKNKGKNRVEVELPKPTP